MIMDSYWSSMIVDIAINTWLVGDIPTPLKK